MLGQRDYVRQLYGWLTRMEKALLETNADGEVRHLFINRVAEGFNQGLVVRRRNVTGIDNLAYAKALVMDGLAKDWIDNSPRRGVA